MSSDVRAPRQRIEDMLEAIARIEAYTHGLDEAGFQSDTKTFDATVRNFEILGEASRHVPAPLTGFYTDAPWRRIGDLRNKAIHDYHRLSPALIYRTARDNLPGLKVALGRMAATLPPSADD